MENTTIITKNQICDVCGRPLPWLKIMLGITHCIEHEESIKPAHPLEKGEQ